MSRVAGVTAPHAALVAGAVGKILFGKVVLKAGLLLSAVLPLLYGLDETLASKVTRLVTRGFLHAFVETEEARTAALIMSAAIHEQP